MNNYNLIPLHFLLRTGMWIPGVTKETVVSFLSGYEAGNSSSLKITKKIKTYLEEEFEIFGSSLGWPYQIEQFSNKNGVEWIHGFKKVSLKILAENLEPSEEEDFKNVVRGFVEGIIDRIEELEDLKESPRIGDWLGVVSCHEEWFIKLWNDAEIELITEMNDEFEKVKLVPGDCADSFKNLVQLKCKYQKQ